MHSYLHGSLLDNVEWTQGYSQRPGPVAVDRTTFTRTPEPSMIAIPTHSHYR
jgi:beta-glucosidase